jgi:hypothetical protein
MQRGRVVIVIDGTDADVLERPGIVIEGAPLPWNPGLATRAPAEVIRLRSPNAAGARKRTVFTVSVSTSRKCGSTEKVCGRGGTPRAKNRGTPSSCDIATKPPAPAGPAAAAPASPSRDAARCALSTAEHADFSSISPTGSWAALSRSSTSPSTSISADRTSSSIRCISGVVVPAMRSLRGCLRHHEERVAPFADTGVDPRYQETLRASPWGESSTDHRVLGGMQMATIDDARGLS